MKDFHFWVIYTTLIVGVINGFILEEISMTEETYKACSTQDERYLKSKLNFLLCRFSLRSEIAGNSAVAKALRNYMTM